MDELQIPEARRTPSAGKLLLRAFGVISLLIALTAGIIYARWLSEFERGFERNAVMFVGEAADGRGEAAVIANFGWNTSCAGLYVDDGRQRSAPMRIGDNFCSDRDVKFRRALWSKDRSVVAVQAEVGEARGNGFRRSDGTYFVAAYDFLRHQQIGDPLGIRPRSEAIRRLFKQRGGSGETLAVRTEWPRGTPLTGEWAEAFELYSRPGPASP